MSDEQFKKSNSSNGTSDSMENPRICSFSIERLLAPSNKNKEEDKFEQQTELICQESE
jgi:hypothetical protein